MGAGGEQSWGQREHHCGPSTPPAPPVPGARGRAVPAPGVEGSERDDHPAALPGGSRTTCAGGGSCVAQQSQHRMLRKELVLHSAPLLGHQKLLNSPKTELGADWGDPCAGRCSSASFSCPPCQGAWCWKGALALLFLGSPAWGSHKAPIKSHCSGSRGSSCHCPRGVCGPRVWVGPLSPELLRRAQAGGSRKSP